MNLTLRVVTDRRSVILKQARPWVEKYDHIEAPWDRVLFEKQFYERVAKIDGVAQQMPGLLGADAAARVILLEDLGNANDYGSLYSSAILSQRDLDDVASYLNRLHRSTRGEPDPLFANRDMRALNHQHIFVLPLNQDLGLPLDDYEPGLNACAARLRGDPGLVHAVSRVGERYLADGPCLLHGDMYPGSWLKTKDGLRVIDPEFCFYGDAEFDVGVAVAHLALSGQDSGLVEPLINGAGQGHALDEALIAHYAGAEIIRRLIGVAQLPIKPTTGWRTDILCRARKVVLESSFKALFL